MSDYLDIEAYEEAEADRERQSAAMADADVAEIVNGLLEDGIVEDAAYVLHVLDDYRSMSNDDLAEALLNPVLCTDPVGLACARVETRRRLPALFKERFRAMDPAAVRDLLDSETPLADDACAAAVEVDHENAVEAERWDRINEAEASGRKYSIQIYIDTGPGTDRSVVIDLTAEQAAKIDEEREGFPLRECWIDERECEAPSKATGPADLAMEREYERQQRDPDDRHYDEEEVFRHDH